MGTCKQRSRRSCGGIIAAHSRVWALMMAFQLSLPPSVRAFVDPRTFSRLPATSAVVQGDSKTPIKATGLSDSEAAAAKNRKSNTLPIHPLVGSTKRFPTAEAATSSGSISLGSLSVRTSGSFNVRATSPSLPVKTTTNYRVRKMSLPMLAQTLDHELRRNPWFVTGKVNRRYFSPTFSYEDVDVRLASLEEYARDVKGLFDQEVTKAEILCTEVNPRRRNTVTCVWRLSGRANVLWGIDIKPFLIYTHFTINERTGLIERQEDEYSIPPWDILLSSVFPFMNGIVTAPEAPAMPKTRKRGGVGNQDDEPHSALKPFEAWASRSGILSYFDAAAAAAAASSSEHTHSPQAKQKQEQQQPAPKPLASPVASVMKETGRKVSTSQNQQQPQAQPHGGMFFASAVPVAATDKKVVAAARAASKKSTANSKKSTLEEEVTFYSSSSSGSFSLKQNVTQVLSRTLSLLRPVKTSNKLNASSLSSTSAHHAATAMAAAKAARSKRSARTTPAEVKTSSYSSSSGSFSLKKPNVTQVLSRTLSLLRPVTSKNASTTSAHAAAAAKATRSRSARTTPEEVKSYSSSSTGFSLKKRPNVTQVLSRTLSLLKTTVTPSLSRNNASLSSMAEADGRKATRQPYTKVSHAQAPRKQDDDEEEELTSSELYAYSDTQPSLKKGGTRAVSQEEAARLLQGKSDGGHNFFAPLEELVRFVSGKAQQQHQEQPPPKKEPEIIAILSDGTKVPAISTPTWRDRAKLYLANDHPKTREALREASRHSKEVNKRQKMERQYELYLRQQAEEKRAHKHKK